MDVWEEARAHLDGLPNGRGLNIAHEAVDRHVANGAGESVAYRFIAPDASVHPMTYGDLARLSNRFANALRSLGVQPGDTVFSLTGRIAELYVAALGTLKARAVFSALYADYGEQPILTRLTKGKAKLLLTTATLYQRRIASIRGAIPHVQVVAIGKDTPEGTIAFDRLAAAASDRLEIAETDPETPSFLHFTSGTSGSPKGAVHVHAAAVAHYATARSVLGLRHGDVYWCTADPGWVTGISYGIVAPLTHGVTAIVDGSSFDPARWYQIIQDHGVTVWYTAPTALRMLMRAGTKLARSYDLSSLRLVASVGEPLNPEVVRWGRLALGRDIHDTWWQTETGAIMIATQAEEEVMLGSIGRALPGIEAAVARRGPGGAFDLVNAPDQVGELVLKAGWPSMFRGYLEEPERYAQCFIEGWYVTGDLVCRDAEGRYSFVSRGDEVIKSAGQLIGPFEVESCLLEHPAVAECGAIGKPDPLIGQAVKAFVVLKEGFAADEDLRVNLVAFARKRLGPAIAPREIAFCRNLPRTGNGKIIRRFLQARQLDLPQAMSDLDLADQG